MYKTFCLPACAPLTVPSRSTRGHHTLALPPPPFSSGVALPADPSALHRDMHAYLAGCGVDGVKAGRQGARAGGSRQLACAPRRMDSRSCLLGNHAPATWHAHVSAPATCPISQTGGRPVDGRPAGLWHQPRRRRGAGGSLPRQPGSVCGAALPWEPAHKLHVPLFGGSLQVCGCGWRGGDMCGKNAHAAGVCIVWPTSSPSCCWCSPCVFAFRLHAYAHLSLARNVEHTHCPELHADAPPWRPARQLPPAILSPFAFPAGWRIRRSRAPLTTSTPQTRPPGIPTWPTARTTRCSLGLW